MSNVAIIKNSSTFDFETNPVEEMDLMTLKRTHKENDVYGNPIKGIYHFEMIDRVMQSCRSHGLNYEVETIFAAQNKNKSMPGVIVLPQVEKIHGEKAIEAHIVRRVFTTIQIKDGSNDELTTNIALAYHQDGIQAAIGPCVKICHNQCILAADRLISTYGKDKVSIEELFNIIDLWLRDFHTDMHFDRERIKKMKARILTPDEILKMIGLLQVTRVAHDSKDKSISAKVKAYPLNQGQISVFTEDLLKLQQRQDQISIWDMYNIATNLYKPGRTDIPVILPQNAVMADMMAEHWGV
ncbi:MAG: DUF932 domain-containing protein [Rikenellaceae bacterium]